MLYSSFIGCVSLLHTIETCNTISIPKIRLIFFYPYPTWSFILIHRSMLVVLKNLFLTKFFFNNFNFTGIINSFFKIKNLQFMLLEIEILTLQALSIHFYHPPKLKFYFLKFLFHPKISQTSFQKFYILIWIFYEKKLNFLYSLSL